MNAVPLIVLLSGCQVVFPLETDVVERPPDCGAVSMLTDDFEDTLLAPWIDLKSTRFGLSNGKLVAKVASASNTDARVDPFLDLRGGSISVVVGAAPRAKTDISRLLIEQVEEGADPFVMQVDGDQLQIGHLDDQGNIESLQTAPFDSTSDSVWKVSYGDGTLKFEVGPVDGPLQTILPAATDVTFVRAHLIARSNTTMGFQATFDDFNGGGPAVGDACPVASITDDFSEVASWGRRDKRHGICTFAVDTAIEITPNEIASSQGYDCSAGPTTFYDLIDQALDIDLELQGGDFPSAEVRFEVQSVDDERAGFRIVVADDLTLQLEAFTETGNNLTPGPRIPYTPSTRLRIRGSIVGGSEFVDLELSTDGGARFDPFFTTGLVHRLDRIVASVRSLGLSVTNAPLIARVIKARGSRI